MDDAAALQPHPRLPAGGVAALADDAIDEIDVEDPVRCDAEAVRRLLHGLFHVHF